MNELGHEMLGYCEQVLVRRAALRGVGHDGNLRVGPAGSSVAGATLFLVDATADVLARLRRFAGAMNPDLPPVDVALGAVRALLEDAGMDFKFVGGVAVVHHGYARTTEDIDVLLENDGPARLRSSLASHGFEAVGELRLRHLPTGVRVDLLVAG